MTAAADQTGHELLDSIGWRSEPLDARDHRQGRRIFDAAGYDLGVMSVFGVRELIAMSDKEWKRDEDMRHPGRFYYTRLDGTAVLSVDYSPERDDSEGMAEPGGWRFSEDGIGADFPYVEGDARYVLHDSPEEAMRAADAWLKAVRQ